MNTHEELNREWLEAFGNDVEEIPVAPKSKGSKSMSVATVADKTLFEMFQMMAGRKFVGVVHGGDCIELIFEQPEPIEKDRNAITLFFDGRIAFGSIGEEYVKLCGHFRA